MDGARIIIMKDIELSLRMKTVADMVKPGGRVCDIGCDHAFVSIYLVANGISDRVIASDVRTGPCAIARDNIARWNMTDHIDLRLGNGLATISPGEVDSIIIAGMGGILITDILEAGMDVVQSAGQLVLQPQSETEHLRRYIAENGWKITEEKMLIDAGKYYVVLNVDVTAQDFGNKSAMDEVYYKYPSASSTWLQVPIRSGPSRTARSTSPSLPAAARAVPCTPITWLQAPQAMA